ncbi:helix-turn-helix domain-containing protein [Nonomuraea wenchangensis]|uniref:helix-turn-helix domain-containing protein n=1 Tax=Nonomuraea wenchangensis TaxID=568860 RepID=UPI00384B8E0A
MTDDVTERAQLSPFGDGRVWLDRRGAEIVAALFVVFERHERGCNRQAAARIPSDVARVRDVVRIAAKPATSENAQADFADEKKPQVVKVVMPSSAPGTARLLSCEAVAELAEVSAQTVRGACRSGRLSAVKVGGSWSIDEASGRRFAAECRARRDRRHGKGNAPG